MSEGPDCIALLRGVNVGSANRVPMATLREIVAELGCEHVRTLLNSGNVVFRAPKPKSDLGTRIRAALRERLGVDTPVVTIGAKDLAAVIDANPLAAVATDPAFLLVDLLSSPAEAERVAPLLERSWEPEAIAVRGRAIYLWCPGSIHKSPLYLAASRCLKDAGTARNLATMRKILALCEPWERA